ncbi:MAG: hypothetical protein M1838_004704 [Thelocarpon superellum]|nr:MAG: hypothetical protein M1838_004704 [Thelocarpon superellum]
MGCFKDAPVADADCTNAAKMVLNHISPGFTAQQLSADRDNAVTMNLSSVNTDGMYNFINQTSARCTAWFGAPAAYNIGYTELDFVYHEISDT